MEIKISLPCPQRSRTGHLPGPHKSTPHPHNLFSNKTYWKQNYLQKSLVLSFESFLITKWALPPPESDKMILRFSNPTCRTREICTTFYKTLFRHTFTCSRYVRASVLGSLFYNETNQDLTSQLLAMQETPNIRYRSTKRSWDISASLPCSQRRSLWYNYLNVFPWNSSIPPS